LSNIKTYITPAFSRRAVRLLFVLLCVILSLKGFSQSTSREYNIKAAFLYNFTQFIEWPANAFTNADAPFVIGILGEDPFGSYIDETVANEKLKGHPVIVQRYSRLRDIRNCNMLFISNSMTSRLQEILAVLDNKSVLTVSDIPNFARNGGMICFVTKENKIKLQINPSAAKDADLNISSKLLRVADIVETPR